MSWLLLRSSLRDLRRHPAQALLSMGGVALAVAAVVAIDLANASAERAMTLSVDGVTGRTTHRITAGAAGLPEALYRELRRDLGVRPSAPVVEGHVALPDHAGIVMSLLGVDPFAEAPFRGHRLGLGGAREDLVALLVRPASVAVSQETAARLGVARGDRLRLGVGTRQETVEIVALLSPSAALDQRSLDDLLLADIATAQELLGLEGRISRIDLIAPAPTAEAAWRERISRHLPAGASLQVTAARSRSMREMTRAFHFNLQALSLMALLLGMFLIYNAASFSVVRRRERFGTLRALGVRGREIFTVILGEALAVALLATGIGIGLGLLLGHGLVGLVARTINDLYYALSVREVAVEPLLIAKAVTLGVGATLIAALAPARAAMRVTPRLAMTRSRLETGARRGARIASRLGVIGLLLGTAICLWRPRSLFLCFLGLLLGIVGAALLVPGAAQHALEWLRRPLRRALGTLGGMAARNLAGSLSRTGVALAALSVGIAVTVGLEIMIASFRGTVTEWLDRSLGSDVYISAPSPIARRPEGRLERDLIERLRSTPGVGAVRTYRGVEVESTRGAIRLVALGIGAASHGTFRFRDGSPSAVWPAFHEGEGLLVSEPLAERLELGVGGLLRLRTARGERSFPVVGVFYSYGSDQGVAMLSRTTYERWWEDRGVTSLAFAAAEGVSPEALVERLRARVPAGRSVVIRSRASLRTASLEVFDRTFTVTVALRSIVALVACVGVLGALMALQLERRREAAVLRAAGMLRRQLLALGTLETALLGGLAGIFALPIGVGIAFVLIHVINRRSFGWTLDTSVPVENLVAGFGLALVTALAAGVLPALRMQRIAPARELRAE